MDTANFHKSIKPLAIEEFLDYYFYRRVAYRIVPLFIRIGATPNQVTTLSLMLGLIASYFVFHQNFVCAAVIAIAAIVIDCCDGQLARLTGQTSPLGRAMDGFFDLVWIAAFWVCLYSSGYFQQNGFPDIFPLMFVSAASMILHCWRFDGVKVKFLELVNPSKGEGDLDVTSAIALAKDRFRKLSLFEAALALILAFQMYFFVRGKETKQTYNLSTSQQETYKQILEPVINKWSYLGEGHHNTIVLLGVLFAKWSPWFLVVAYLFIAIPMNLWWFYCEAAWMKAFRHCRQDVIQQTMPIVS